jgi:hypothetical protein
MDHAPNGSASLVTEKLDGVLDLAIEHGKGLDGLDRQYSGDPAPLNARHGCAVAVAHRRRDRPTPSRAGVSFSFSFC